MCWAITYTLYSTVKETHTEENEMKNNLKNLSSWEILALQVLLEKEIENPRVNYSLNGIESLKELLEKIKNS